MPKKLTSEEFIQRSVEKHNSKYDYSKALYENSNKKITIICQIHGEFTQRPSDHMRGIGCRKCADDGNSVRFRSNKDEFVRKAKEIHGDKYDYSSINYTNALTKVKIICKFHGEFYQKPSGHLSGMECFHCGKSKAGSQRKLTTEEFIKKAVKIHGLKYDYSQAEYIGNDKKLDIVCKKHGIFYQTANDHLQGCGCPKCKSSKGEAKIRQILNENKIIFEEQVKFTTCVYKCKLPFDFYIPSIKTLVEFDGQLHFKSVRYFGGDSQLELIKLRDSIKTKWAEDNGYNLIRIAYNESINDKLSVILQH